MYYVLLNGPILQRNIASFTNMLPISTKSTPLDSPLSPWSNKNPVSLALLLLTRTYLAMFSILPLTCTAGSAGTRGINNMYEQANSINNVARGDILLV